MENEIAASNWRTVWFYSHVTYFWAVANSKFCAKILSFIHWASLDQVVWQCFVSSTRIVSSKETRFFVSQSNEPFLLESLKMSLYRTPLWTTCMKTSAAFENTTEILLVLVHIQGAPVCFLTLWIIVASNVAYLDWHVQRKRTVVAHSSQIRLELVLVSCCAFLCHYVVFINGML